MRQHRRYQRIAPAYDAQNFHALVRAEHLCAARLDPGFGLHLNGEGLLDLVFACDGRVAIVPYVMIQGVMLLLRENSAFLWPVWIPPLRRDAARAIEERVEPWLTSLTLARFASAELLEFFGDDAEAHDLVRRARARAFLGAAPYEDVMLAASPYVYAMRFAGGRRVAASDPRGASGAAMLARVAASVEVDFGDVEAASDASRWFDRSFAGDGAAGCDVFIGPRERGEGARFQIALDTVASDGERRVEVASPIPPPVMVSFDTGDADRARAFAVSAPAVEARASRVAPPKVVGGSSGRIALVVRGDYSGNRDADGDAAVALASRLDEQGFSASVVPARHLRTADFDLVHVIGRRAAADALASLDRGGKPLPLVVSPYADDPRGEAAWGANVHHASITNAPDIVVRESYFAAIATRGLEAPGAPLRGQNDPADAALGGLLKRAGAAVVSGEEEERRLREAFGFTGETRFVAALLGEEPQASGAGALTGDADYVFLHAPLEPRCNQFALAQAAAELGYPLVLVGSVQDFNYYGEVMGALGPGGAWFSDDQLAPEELAALYRRARVFADVSWSSNGLQRLARAAAAGAALVAPTSGFARGVWPGLVRMVDPAGGTSIAAGLKDAWERFADLGPATAARTAEACDPFSSLVATLGAYQAAAAKT